MAERLDHEESLHVHIRVSGASPGLATTTPHWALKFPAVVKE
jgi:hypothetical protein